MTDFIDDYIEVEAPTVPRTKEAAQVEKTEKVPNVRSARPRSTAKSLTGLSATRRDVKMKGRKCDHPTCVNGRWHRKISNTMEPCGRCMGKGIITQIDRERGEKYAAIEPSKRTTSHLDYLGF